MDIQFHCMAEHNFRNERQQVRAFLYTDYSIEAHNHDFYEMNIVFNGRGTHQIERARFCVKTGDVFIIPPMTVHAYYDTKELDVYHVLLQKKFIIDNQKEASAVPGFLQLVEIEPFLRQHFSNEMFLHLSSGQLMQLKSDLSFIEEDTTYDEEALIPLKNHTAWKILYWFSYLLSEQMYQGRKKALNHYDMEIIRILEYIHQNYESKMTIDLLCKKSFLSRSTFLRSFHNVCGCTPMEYINQYRCKKALEMMDDQRFSKTEIAHSCGFYDLSHMKRAMKHAIQG